MFLVRTEEVLCEIERDLQGTSERDREVLCETLQTHLEDSPITFLSFVVSCYRRMWPMSWKRKTGRNPDIPCVGELRVLCHPTQHEVEI